MRRLLYSLFALCFMGALAGCCCTHGVCDCDFDDNCSTRAPWIQVSSPSANTGGTHTAENLDTASKAQ